MKILFTFLIVVFLAGCGTTPRQLPPRARVAYAYTFYGRHKRLTPYEDTRARRLFLNYSEAYVQWTQDEGCPCSCNYNDVADFDRMLKTEGEVYEFIDSIRK